jgi:hypothetical protein
MSKLMSWSDWQTVIDVLTASDTDYSELIDLVRNERDETGRLSQLVGNYRAVLRDTLPR